MKYRTSSILLAAGVIAAALLWTPKVKADEWDRKTTITFNNPVEIPGMVLMPGTYTMKLLDYKSTANNVVEFLNENQTHLYKMVMAIPAYRLEPVDHTVITFEERAAGAPQAIKEWFFPGNLWGEELVYPKVETPHPIAVSSEPPVITPPPAPPTPVAEVKPAPQPPVEIAQAAPPPPPPPAAPAPAPAPVETTPPQELPKTASNLPAIALLGSVLIGAGSLTLRKSA